MQTIHKEFEGCGWIWYDHSGIDDVNVYMYARKDFLLDGVPEAAEIKITADSRYKLYVNGLFVCRGPARGYPDHYPFDRVDVAKFLKKGKNVIAVLVHQYGHGTFQSIYAGSGGLLVSGVIGTKDIGTKEESWLIKRCTARKQEMARRSIQMGYQELFDRRKEDGGWMLPETVVKHGENGWSFGFPRPVGCAPWFEVEERGIPLLKETDRGYKKIIYSWYGDCTKNWEDTRNLTLTYLAEQDGVRDYSRTKNPDAMLAFDDLATEVLPLPAGKRLSLIVDFGEEVAGFPGVEIQAHGGEVIDFTTAETLKNDWPCVIDPAAGCKVATSDRVILKPGKQTFETFSMHGFRYLCVTFRNVFRPLKISRIYVNTVSYPFEKQASFESSDPVLNRIWEMCIRTQKCCSFDAYVDCPWREQAQWWGDARVQAANTYYAFGDMRLFRRGIKQAGESQIFNGLTLGHFPGINSFLPDFTLTWVQTHLDYYLYTHDVSLLREQFPALEKALKFFSGYCEKNYLLGGMPEWWLFLDWAPLYKKGWSTLFNLLYLTTLRDFAVLCGILKKKERQVFYLGQADVLLQKITKIFWNPKRKIFYDGFDPIKREPVETISQHVHALAILLNLKKPFHADWAKQILFPPMRKEPLADKKIVEASPFFYYYTLNALKRTGGYGDEIIEFIKRRWGRMLDEGATTCYEIWNPERGHVSICHGWSAHPIVHFTEILAGLHPASAEWKKVRITKPGYGLEHLSFVKPVEGGEIRIEIKNGKHTLIKLPRQIAFSKD